MACGPGGLPPVPTISAAGAALGRSFRRIIHARGAVLWACRPRARAASPMFRASPAQRAPHDLRGAARHFHLSLESSQCSSSHLSGLEPPTHKTVSTNTVITSSLRVYATSSPIRRYTVVYQRIALFDERCCNDSLRNTHVNKKHALSDSQAAVSRDHGP